MKEIIRKEVEKVLHPAVELRHRLHEIPEGSFCEEKTANLIIEELHKIGLSAEKRIARTGIITVIHGKRPGNVVALRADMDAIAIDEHTSKPYASLHKGFSHGCGHDGHIVCVLKAAQVLFTLREYLAGAVKIIFQPAEEIGSGAKAMIEEGALDNPSPSAIIALHSWTYLGCGIVASKPGIVTAINDHFLVTLKGKGGHGARPQECINPIVCASRIVQKVNDLMKEGMSLNNVDSQYVISIGKIHGGTQANVIPDDAALEGTIRSKNIESRENIMDIFKKAVRDICIQESVEAVIEFRKYCPSVNNHPVLYELFEKVADDLLPSGTWQRLADSSMGSEDFGFYTQKIPGLLIRLGMGESSPPLHTSSFDFCDDALGAGITILAGMAMKASERDFAI
ncbi:MAG: amidohydrolase [Planctomycetes bacterium]|nr:amidohydrolase [Planctomycetota bacterium]